MNREKIKKELNRWDWCIVAGVSVLLMLIQIQFDPHTFLTDDNAIQFYPVVDKVYDSFLKTGRLPFYDFFQMKGMVIGDEGYYCQTNVLMFISWLLTKSILPSFDCMTLYGVICIVLGNIGWNLLFVRMRFSLSKRVLAICMETTVSVFLWFGYWFYAFNSYIVIPFLLVTTYRMFVEKHKSNLYLSGLVLFFSLMLGNVQFTVYHYMLFGLISVLYIIMKSRYDRIKLLLCNIMVGIGLSMPVLMSQLNAADRRKLAVTEDGFFKDSVKLLDWIINGFVPGWTLYNHKETVGRYSVHIFYQIFMPGMMICFFVVLFLCVRKIIHMIRKKRTFIEWTTYLQELDDKNTFMICGMLCTFFFVIFRAGKGYGVADLIHLLPVVNQFRWLYKLSIIIAPLMILTSIYVIDRYKWGGMIIAIGSVLMGLGQNLFLINSDEAWMYNDHMRSRVSRICEYDKMHEELRKAGVDLNNYRILGMSSDYDLFGDDHYDARFLSANYPTLFGMYSVGGYEMAVMQKGFQSTAGFFLDIGFDYAFNGHVMACMLLQKNDNGDFLLNRVLTPMMNNAAKYYMFRNDVKEEQLFVEMVTEEYGMPEPERIQLSNGVRIYVLEAAPKLCEGATIAENVSIDQIVLHVEEDYDEEYLSVKFSRNDGVKAYAIVDGVKTELQLLEDQEGDILIPMRQELKGADVFIYYGNAGDNILLYYGMLGALLTMIIVTVAVFGKGDEESVDSSKNE